MHDIRRRQPVSILQIRFRLYSRQLVHTDLFVNLNLLLRVFHYVQPKDFEIIIVELYRILRPGGYIYFHDGQSNDQVIAIEDVVNRLGFQTVWRRAEKHRGSRELNFSANIPYDWHIHWIWVKPSIRVSCSSNK